MRHRKKREYPLDLYDTTGLKTLSPEFLSLLIVFVLTPLSMKGDGFHVKSG